MQCYQPTSINIWHWFAVYPASSGLNSSPLPQDPSVLVLNQDCHHLWCLCPQTSTVAQLAQPCNPPVIKLMAALRWATRHPGAVICCCRYTKGALFGLQTGMCPGHRQDQGLPLGLRPGPSPEGGPPLSRGVCQAQDHQDVLIPEHRARFSSTRPLSQGSGWLSWGQLVKCVSAMDQ